MAAVAVNGCQAGEGGDLAAVELTQFWQGGQELAGGDRSNAFNFSQGFFFSVPDRVLLDGKLNVVIEFLNFPIQELKALTQTSDNARGGGLLEAIAFGGPDFVQLLAA